MRRCFTYLFLIPCLILLCSFRVQATVPEERDVEHSWCFSQDVLYSQDKDNKEKPSHPDATLLGIDVSHHQGEIDWDAVAQSEVDFVIIRCGYGMDQEDQDDREFLNNVNACERLGIPYGVYLYSYATNTERAQSEAEHVLRLINGRTLSYPVFYDLEDSTAIDYDLAAIATTFCSQIQAAGYPVGIYSSVYWWDHYLTDPCFDQWYRWVAHYNPTCAYTGEYQLWQFSSKGAIDGISGNVDLNYQIGFPEDHGNGTFFHTYTADVTEPICTEPGFTKFTCSDCGIRYTACRKDMVEHAWDEGNVLVPSTCSEPGSVLRTCQDCGESREQILPLEWHNVSDGICVDCGTESPIRIAGDNRYATGFAVADQLKSYLGVAKFNAVVVASGREFPDALAGSYLANQKKAPILLVNGKDPQSIKSVRNYIAENLESNGRVYILGGTAAVSAEMEKALKDFRVKRLAGSNRYGTNLEILKEAGTGSDEILICTGKGFADSLSASAVNKPILLLNNKTITAEQKAFLEGSSRKFIIIGGTSAINEEIAAELAAIGCVDRIAGDNRYKTSIAVANRFFESPKTTVLAYAKKFPDGLCGGPLANALRVPLILTADKVEAEAAAYINANGIQGGLVLGGTSALTEDTVNKVFG